MQPVLGTASSLGDRRPDRSLNGPAAARRICFVATGLGRGGAELQLFRAATGLRARGFDVQVICMLSADHYAGRLEEAGVPVRCLDASRTTGALWILARFLRCVWELQPDALAGFDYPGSLLARIGGAAARIPVVVSCIRSERLGGHLRQLALSLTDRLATITTTNSRAVAMKLVDAGAASPHRVRVIPNGIDLEKVGPYLRRERQVLRRELGVADQEFLWFTAGSLEAPKDYPNLLAAMVSLGTNGRRVRLLIAGQGSLRQSLEQQVSSLGLQDRVSFLGYRDDVPACMAAADATVLASAWEGLPNVVIESLAVETPVVCTDVGGIREIVTHGESGFIVQPGDPLALAGAMWAMMARSDKHQRSMGAVGRRHVERHFGLDRVICQWRDLLDELLGAA